MKRLPSRDRQGATYTTGVTFDSLFGGLMVPADLAAGNQEVIVGFGNYASPGGVTVDIR
jgi:hypothetical protein